MDNNRSITFKGNALGNVVTTGDGNHVRATQNVQWNRRLPAAESVNISSELASIRAIIIDRNDGNAAKTSRALDDAEEEARKESPDKDEIGKALERAIDYAKKSNNFAVQATKLAPHLAGAASWLGTAWHTLLSLSGLALPQ